MNKNLVSGGLLNQIAGTGLRRPRCMLHVWDPSQTTIADVVTGKTTAVPLDITHFVESVTWVDNSPYENDGDTKFPSASFTFRQSSVKGIKMRRGLIEDGVIMRLYIYDDRVSKADAVPILTGHFRGDPGVDPGTRGENTRGFTATAYGREEQFQNLTIEATDQKPAGTDLGDIFFQIATGTPPAGMGLTQDEVLVGSLGFVTLHTSNQIKQIPAMQALWECTFPAGKKPKFNGWGELVAVDFDLDKPATRIYSAGNFPIRALRPSPNDVEVNNSILVVGLDHNMSKVVQELQMLREIEITVGFFRSKFNQTYDFSEKREIMAEDTRLRTLERLKFSSAKYTQADPFSGTIKIDTHYLAAVREIIFGVYLATQLAIAAIDYFFQAGDGAVGVILSAVTFGALEVSLATERLALQILSQIALAGLLWAMNYIGMGRYQIWGKPYEMCYQELKSRCQLAGLDPQEVREVEIRNDFISKMEDLDRIARERLRRELVKGVLYDVEILDDPALEVDRIFETFEGSRFYIVSIERRIAPRSPAIAKIKAWKVYGDFLAKTRDAASSTTGAQGYGYGYGSFYGDQL